MFGKSSKLNTDEDHVETFVRQNDDGSFLVAISGSINEYAQTGLRTLASQVIDATAIEVNMGNIEIINSIGTIYWAQCLQQLCQIAPVEISNCSITVVDYINRLPAMAKGATVSSFHVPYRCTLCRRIFTQFFSTQQIKADPQFTKTNCDKCGGESVSEVEFEDYTEFLNTQR